MRMIEITSFIHTETIGVFVEISGTYLMAVLFIKYVDSKFNIVSIRN